jgi:hypothetical protein
MEKLKTKETVTMPKYKVEVFETAKAILTLTIQVNCLSSSEWSSLTLSYHCHVPYLNPPQSIEPSLVVLGAD